MTDTDESTMLEQALRRLLTDHCDPDHREPDHRDPDHRDPDHRDPDPGDVAGRRSPGLWVALAAMGVPGLGIPEERGGSGGTVEDAALAVRLAAGFAAPVPIAETALLGGRLLADAGLDVPEGAALACALDPLERHRDTVSGVAERVPWAADCSHLVALAGPDVVLLAMADARVVRGTNPAGEARDRVRLDRAVPVRSAPAPVSPEQWRARAAAVRALQISGAADRVVELCVEHARVREQFGQPIGRFQAVAHLLARAAGAAVAAQGAARLAVLALRGDDPVLAGSAKTVAGEAAGTVAALAHQVHGAIGMTREHRLHLFTRRLWAWRDECGGERYWARRCGRALVADCATPGATPGDDPWAALVAA